MRNTCRHTRRKAHAQNIAPQQPAPHIEPKTGKTILGTFSQLKRAEDKKAQFPGSYIVETKSKKGKQLYTLLKND